MRSIQRASIRPDPRLALWLVFGYVGLIVAAFVYSLA